MSGRQRGGLPALPAVLILFLVCSGAGVVAGQAGNATNGSNGTAAAGTATNGSAGNGSNATGGPAAGAGGGFGLDPVGAFMDMVGAFGEALLSAGGGMIEAVNSAAFRIPAPGEPGELATWNDPDGWLWAGVMENLPLTRGLGIVLWGLALARTFYATGERERRARLRRCGYAGAMILFAVPVTALSLHITGGVASALAPSAGEFFSTEGAAKLASGGAGVLILGVINAGTIFAAAFAVVLLDLLIYVSVYLWPLAWAARAHDGLVRSLGETGTHLFGLAVGAKFVQALLARLLFEFPVVGDAGAGVRSFLLILGGVLFVFFIFPVGILDKANDAAAVSLGMSNATRTAGDYGERSVQRVYGEVTDRYQSYRGGGSSGSGATGATVGQVGSGSSASSSTSTADVDSPAAYRDGSSRGSAPGDDVTRPADTLGGIDANEWAEQRDRIDYRRDRDRDHGRGFQ
jgi:hypothetical protein